MSNATPDTPLTLAFDTTAAHCAATLLGGDTVLACRAEAMTRGQAERLFPLLEELLETAGATWRDLTTLGVGTGPGNFTGIRLSVSAARGLALSLGIPAYGVDRFAAIALGQAGPVLAAVPAPRGQIYVKAPDRNPELTTAEQASRHYAKPLTTLDDPIKLVTNIARLAAQGEGTSPPAPLYVRPADAAPSRAQPPQIIENGT